VAKSGGWVAKLEERVAKSEGRVATASQRDVQKECFVLDF
jgi:hypothetical protein